MVVGPLFVGVLVVGVLVVGVPPVVVVRVGDMLPYGVFDVVAMVVSPVVDRRSVPAVVAVFAIQRFCTIPRTVSVCTSISFIGSVYE